MYDPPWTAQQEENSNQDLSVASLNLPRRSCAARRSAGRIRIGSWLLGVHLFLALSSSCETSSSARNLIGASIAMKACLWNRSPGCHPFWRYLRGPAPSRCSAIFLFCDELVPQPQHLLPAVFPEPPIISNTMISCFLTSSESYIPQPQHLPTRPAPRVAYCFTYHDLVFLFQ